MTPRIAPAPATGNPPEVQEILDAMSAAVGGAANVNRTLARHPGVMRRFSGFVGKLTRGSLAPRDRELAIMRVAWDCRSPYEWGQHHRVSLTVGLTPDELASVPDPEASCWNAADRALLQACDELVHQHRIRRDTWAKLADRYDDQQLIELMLLVGAYTMVAGFLNSVEVEAEPGIAPLPSS